MDESGRPLGVRKRRPLRAEEIAAERLFRGCLENTTATGRTALLRAYRHRERFELSEDFDLWARVAADHKLACLPEVLVRRREHAGRTTRGRRERIEAHRLEIFAEQLGALGLSFTREDLERHHLLRRMQKAGFRPDAEYLRWAEGWLSALREANARVGAYPEPAFRELLAWLWLKSCWCAAAPRRFWRSPLRGDALAGLWRRARWRLAVF
jgi:hypothetical protein